MAWVRIEDTFPEHPKVLGLSADAFRLYVIGLCYASRYLTDGFVPALIVVRSPRLVSELVDAGLWAPTGDDDGYAIHDYLVYQPSRVEVEERRKAQSEAGRRGAERRWGRDGGTP